MDSDVITLTTPLVAAWRSKEEMGGIRLRSLDVGDVREYLRRNLRWRVLDVSSLHLSFSPSLSLPPSLKSPWWIRRTSSFRFVSFVCVCVCGWKKGKC